MTLKQVVSFARERGCETAEYQGQWRGYDVYDRVFEGEETVIVGLPYIILVKGDEIRMSTEDEAFQYIDEMEVDDEDDEDEEA